MLKIYVTFAEFVRHAPFYGPADAIRKESRAIRTDLLPGLEIPLASVVRQTD